MKTVLRISILMSFFLWAVGMAAQDKKSSGNAKLAPITIEGHIKGVKNRTMVYLYRKNGFYGKKVGEKAIVNGYFKMTVVPETELDKYNISVATFKGTLSFYSNPGQTTKVTGVGNRPANWMAENDTPLQQEVNNYRNFDKENFPNLLRDENRLRMLKDSLYINQKVSSFDYNGNEGLVSLRNSVKKQRLERAVVMLDFLKDKPYSQAWLDAFYEIRDFAKKGSTYAFSDEQLEKTKLLFKKIPEKELETEKALEISRNLFHNELKVGDKFIDCKLFDHNGKEHKISELLFKNKLVILEFSFQGCGGCYSMQPILKELYSKHSDKLDILTIDCSNKAVWDKMENTVAYNEWNDHKRGLNITRHYDILGYPTFFFVSPDGIIVGKSMISKFAKTLSECIPDL